MKCSIEGCEKPVKVRGWCMMHYTRWQRHGDPLYRRQFKRDEPCSVDGCERKKWAAGYCHTHYAKIRRTGTLEKINHGPEWKRKMSLARKTELSHLDPTPDPKHRGYLAVNLVNDLRYKARQRGIEWQLSNVEAYRLITGECVYCGYTPDWPNERIGIDRVNNFKGYTIENSVACCTTCNSAKMSRTMDEFKEWVKRIYLRMHKD